MVKTHKKSKFYRIPEKDLGDFDKVIIQIEHIAEPIKEVYYCIVEAVSTEDYYSEMEHYQKNHPSPKLLYVASSVYGLKKIDGLTIEGILNLIYQKERRIY